MPDCRRRPASGGGTPSISAFGIGRLGTTNAIQGTRPNVDAAMYDARTSTPEAASV